MNIKKSIIISISFTVLFIMQQFYISCEPVNQEQNAIEKTESIISTPETIKFIRKNTLTAATPETGEPFINKNDLSEHIVKHGLKLFLLTTDLNPDLPFNISCYISHMNISALIPAGINLSAIKIEFKHSGQYIKIKNETLVSGQSILDLSEPVDLIIASKSGTEFTVTLNIETLNTGLPSISLMTENNRTINSKTDYIPCSLYIGGGEPTLCPYATEETIYSKGNIKGRGHTSWGFPKKSYTLKLDKKTAIFDLPASKNWTLISNYQDKTLLRNDFASKFADVIGLEANMKTRSVDLWLNGSYWGIYLITEKVEIEESRINIKEFNSKLPPDKIGYLFEWDGHIQEIPQKQKNNWEVIENVIYDPAQNAYFINTTGWLVIKNPSPENLTPEHLKYLYEHIIKIEYALDNGDFVTVDKYMDLQSFVKWFLVEDIMKNMDAAFWSSCYMYLDESGVLHMGPVWDFDMSLGNCNYGGCDTPDGDYISDSWYYRHLFRIPEFRVLAKKILHEKYDNILSMKKYAEDMAAMLDKALKHNFSLWNILCEPVGANPPAVIEANTYEAQLEILLGFFERRLTYVSNYINNLE